MRPKPAVPIPVAEPRIEEAKFLETELGRSPSATELQALVGLVGTTRASRETLVRVMDGSLVRAAWNWERTHRNRGTVVFQLRARMNTLGVTESVGTQRHGILGTITRPRTERRVEDPGTLTVPHGNVEKTLAELAKGIPALRAMGIRRIVLELDEE